MRYYEIICENEQFSSLAAIVEQYGEGIKSIGSQKLEIYRVGSIDDTGRGIFFGGSRHDAAQYGSLHARHAVKKYFFTAKNVLLASNQWAVFTHFTGKPFSGAEFDKLAYRLKSSSAAATHVDKMVAQKARRAGFDAIIYTHPRPPAKLELQIVKFDPKSLTELSSRV